MALQLGLVGLPNVGKSTLFNALTQAGATVANYPFTTIDPNIGVVPVPDSRLQRIADIVHPEKVVPATLRVVDIAGLVKGASHGEGLGNQFLSHIRGADAIAMVVRCFRDENVPHVATNLDPVEDIETIGLELILSDLEIMERHLERLGTRAKANPREFEREISIVERVLAALRGGQPIRQLELEHAEREALREIPLLTIMPVLYVCNVGEDSLPEGGDLAQLVRTRAEGGATQAIAVCALLEAELTGWDADDAKAYLGDLGLEASGLERFIWAGYRLLDLITFFTTTGGREVRAWTLQRGQTAIEAAGKIHTDMARGFIRAEVVAFNDLGKAGSLAAARERGRLRLEGRDYIVQDGDVLHIRFNV